MARQGIEPWSTDYETAALPLSYRATGLRVDTILRELGEVLSLRGSFGVVLRFQDGPAASRQVERLQLITVNASATPLP